MLRAATTATLCAALLALGACQQGQSTGGGRAAPDLAGAFSRTYGTKVAGAFPAAQRDDVARCIGQALAFGIPLRDQFLIFDQIDTGKATPASRAAMQRWLDGPVVHGPLRKTYVNNPVAGPTAKLSPNEGVVAPEGGVVATRVEGNVLQFCRRYKDPLMKAGYIAGGSGPGGGFSNKN